jgi:hypothetical protein
MINKWKEGVEDSDYDSLIKLAVYSKKGRIRFKRYYLNNYIQKLGANQDHSFVFCITLQIGYCKYCLAVSTKDASDWSIKN